MKKITIILVVLYGIFSYNYSEAAIKDFSKLYIGITNPVECFTGNNSVYKELYMTPQQNLLENYTIDSVILISRINYAASNRFEIMSYSEKHDNALIKLITFGNNDSLERLNAAYRMGTYCIPYALFSYDYGGDNWHLVSCQLDAFSNLVYGFSWIINTPQKLINKLAFICSKDSYFNIYTLLDIPINIFSCVFDTLCCIAGTYAGFFLGFLFHPIDSICSFFGMFYFIIYSFFIAIIDFIIGLLSFVAYFI